MLPKEAVIEFQGVYEKINGVQLSFEEAVAKSEELITLFQAVYKPIKKSTVDSSD